MQIRYAGFTAQQALPLILVVLLIFAVPLILRRRGKQGPDKEQRGTQRQEPRGSNATKADMRAGWSGKIRTALSFPIGCLLYAYVAFHWGWLSRPLMMGIEVFGLLVNFYSVYDYTKRYGFAFRENMRK